MKFLVTSAPGLQGLLKEELLEIGIPNPTEEESGVVSFEGEWNEASKVLIRSRIASRLLLSLRKFSARNVAMLYDQVRRIDWDDFLQPEMAFAVFAHGNPGSDTDFKLSFAPLKIKDAICDEMRKRCQGFRPMVDRQNPDARIEAFFNGGKCELSVDLSGEALHRRGYREDSGESPLRENRAAALLRFAGFDGSQDLHDPFCGSGTIAIEAALIQQKIAPGLLRPTENFAISKLFPAASAAFAEERKAAEAEKSRTPPKENRIRASDLRSTPLINAKQNARTARVYNYIEFFEANALKISGENLFLVFNPPYGERLRDLDSAIALLKDFGHHIKHNCPGTKLHLIIPKGELEGAIGFRASRRLNIENGPFASVFLKFEIYSGSKRGTAASDEKTH